MKRPNLVDLTADLRITGNGSPSIHISTDEGDGYSLTNIAKEGSIEVEEKHFIEWAEQLEHVATYLRKNSGK